MTKKMLAALLALIMVFALFGCATTETPPSAEPTTVPTTPSSERLEAELTRIRELCAQEKDELQRYKEELQMKALDALDELDVAESTLLTGSPILVEFEYSTPGMGSRVETHSILAVSEGNVPFPYRFSSQGDVLEKVRFRLESAKDVLSVNLHGYTSDANGVVEIDIAEEEWFGFEICWDRPKTPPFVAQFEITDSESQQNNDSYTPDPSSVAVYIQEVNDLRPQLDEEQEKNIDDILAELQSLHEEITEYEEEYRPLFEHLDKVEHALYNGIPVEFSSEFKTATPAINLMATEAGSPVFYTFHNPWAETPGGGEIHATKLFFTTPFPLSTVIINGDTFYADENGIVELPLNGAPIPNEISLKITDCSGTTYILKMDGKEPYAVFAEYWENMHN